MDKQILYLFLFILAGCSKGERNSPNVFFAGEIVNPTSTHIVLYKGDKVIDSAALDEQNRFSFRFDSLPKGLYHFNHTPELQYVYLEGGDSVMIRLNTIDFDESLAFSGRGSEISSFLLELFLAQEAELQAINTYFNLEANEFAKKVDSLKQLKLILLEDLVEDGDISKHEESIAKTSIEYAYNTHKEKYPFRHKNLAHAGVMEKLPKGFYDYRSTLEFGNEELTYLRPYYNFMLNHIQNVAFMDCSERCKVKKKIVKNQLHFNEHKLHIIDSLVTAKELKDNLFRYVAFNYLLKVHDPEENKKFIKEFHRLSRNNKHLEEIENLYQGIENIQPNKMVPDVYVSKVNGDTVSLRKIAEEGKTVFYFWSGVEKQHFENTKKRIALLTEQRPEYRYVGINVNTSEKAWKSMLEISSLDKELQYRAIDFEELTNSLIIYPPNKCVITKDAMIVDAFSNLYASF
ncbi:transaldolase [Flavobacteriaceae bacterium TP-CH-4]|uniref:Transaldolase n=1 Tax=Pelagihabitans pacificus TaxID=2696054 RepID=A0A967E5B5_9FLAO|nr:transaldolase [Pelagihabitans pacificus]NHF59267.1 transaldolase [Pelagihabitans pacificus]